MNYDNGTGLRFIATKDETIEQFAERLINEKAKRLATKVMGDFEGIEMHITARDTVESIIRKYENGLGRVSKYNPEHYMDLTAYEAIKNADSKDYERFKRLMGCIFRMCELAGFHIEERLVVKDLKTGKVWR